MHAYLWRPGPDSDVNYITAVFIASRTFKLVAMGDMPESELGKTIITDNPIPRDKQRSMHFEPFESLDSNE